MSVIPYTPGNIPTYRFYLSEASSTTYEVFPLNFISTSIVSELEKDQIFYRNKFSGSLIFGSNSIAIDVLGASQNRKDDFDFLWAMEQHDPCAPLFLTITKTVAGVTTQYPNDAVEFYFSTTDGFFDLDRCTFEVTPMTLDDYTSLLEVQDEEFNILDVATHVTTVAVHPTLGTFTYTRNRWLIDTIEYLADTLLTGVTVSSDFFSVTPNYVTSHLNHLLYLTIAQKSDIIRPTSTDPATTAMLSWRELMEILWAMFQVRWDYDAATDTINVEHISWWTKAAGIDLRTQKLTVSTNKYSYTKEVMPKYEKFNFMEGDETNFVDSAIRYDSACVDQNPDTNVKEQSIRVTTDLEYIITNPEAINDDGFVILNNYVFSPGVYHVRSEISKWISSVRLNMHLSWVNLQDRYFRYNRVLITGIMHGSVMTFWTALKTKKQECSAIVCTDFDPDDEITTELGETYFAGAKAIVQRSELRPTGEIKLNLLYGPADNAATEIEDDKYIIVYEDGCGSFTAELSEAADADLDILIKYIVYDVDLNVVCSCNAGVTWTIASGAVTGDPSTFYTIPAAPPPPGDCNCDPADIPAGGCIRYITNPWEVTGRDDWPISFIADADCECEGF